MYRIALVVIFFAPLVASAQDMPLHTFTKDGEGWVRPDRVEGSITSMLYAATSEDLQVFDPNGRLSGVLTLPVKGKVEAMVWEGTEKYTLAMWIGKQKWTRRMNIR